MNILCQAIIQFNEFELQFVLLLLLTVFLC